MHRINISIVMKTPKLFLLFLLLLISCGSTNTGDENVKIINMDDPLSDQLPPENQPAPPPNPGGPIPDPELPLNEFQSDMLFLVNEARAQSRMCGSDFFPAAPAVIWDTRIQDSAFVHSMDMAESGQFSHIGTDGSNPGDRLLMEGYNWSTWGENILVGLEGHAAVIDAWLDTEGHCSILMNPAFKEVGIDFAEGMFGGRMTLYWTLDIATESN